MARKSNLLKGSPLSLTDSTVQRRRWSWVIPAVATLAAAALAVILMMLPAFTATPNPSVELKAQPIEMPSTPLHYSGNQVATTPEKVPATKTHGVVIDASTCETVTLPGITTAYTAAAGSEGACWIYIQRNHWQDGSIIGEVPQNVISPFEYPATQINPTASEIVIGLRGRGELSLTTAHVASATPLTPVKLREAAAVYFLPHDNNVWWVKHEVVVE